MSGLNEKCSNCGQPSAFLATSHRLEPPRKVRRGGMDLVEEPFGKYGLCEPCAITAATGPTPPRSITALPHHRKVMADRMEQEQRKAEGTVVQERLGDWGRRRSA